MQYLIGVDIGTSGSKAVMTDETGHIYSSGYQQYNYLTRPGNRVEQDPAVWVKGFIGAVRECVESAGKDQKEIKALAVSGLYGGSGVPVDTGYTPLGNCLIWMDRRARDETEWIKERIDGKTLLSITGNYVDSYFGITKILWLKNNRPDIWKKTHRLMTPKDYLIYLMTGEDLTDYSSAGNIGGVFDLKKMTWSDQLLRELRIEPSKFPEKIVESTAVAGYLNETFAGKTGLQKGLPVIAGGIDAPVAQLSGGTVREREHVAMVGTSMCWGFLHDGSSVSKGLVSFPYVLNGEKLVYSFGGGATSGAIVEWFANQLGGVEMNAAEEAGLSVYELLELKARRSPPGANGLIVLPYFMGERSPIWDQDARGMLFGLNLSHTRADIYRAFLEGVAYSLRHNMEAAQTMAIDLEETCSIVGGAAKSPLWLRIFADITGYKVKRTIQNVEAPLGDAFLAGRGIGLIEKVEKIKEWVQYEEPIPPDPQNRTLYKKQFDIYKALYERNADLMKKI